jgi:hypothetical protein
MIAIEVVTVMYMSIINKAGISCMKIVDIERFIAPVIRLLMKK